MSAVNNEESERNDMLELRLFGMSGMLHQPPNKKFRAWLFNWSEG
jgi:hypothetical protein